MPGGLGWLGCGCCGVPSLPCSPCAIPEQNLMLSWTAVNCTSGSGTLTYNSGPRTWTLDGFGGGPPGCDFWNAVLNCDPLTGAINFGIGTVIGTNYCSTSGSVDGTIPLTSFTCGAGFTLIFLCSVVDCTAFGLCGPAGFSGFTITL